MWKRASGKQRGELFQIEKVRGRQWGETSKGERKQYGGDLGWLGEEGGEERGGK